MKLLRARKAKAVATIWKHLGAINEFQADGTFVFVVLRTPTWLTPPPSIPPQPTPTPTYPPPPTTPPRLIPTAQPSLPPVSMQFNGAFKGATWNFQALFARRSGRREGKQRHARRLIQCYDFVGFQETHSTPGAVKAMASGLSGRMGPLTRLGLVSG
jgi:hypothetical protein